MSTYKRVINEALTCRAARHSFKTALKALMHLDPVDAVNDAD